MFQNDRPLTFKELRELRIHQNQFIGREAQIREFRNALNTPYTHRTTLIFNLSGQGGIGKTTLLKQFRKAAEEFSCAIAYVDEGAQSNRVDNLSEALARLVSDFEKQGYKFEKFQERYKVYRQRRQELESDPEAPQGFAAGLGRILTKFSLGAAKSIPGSSTVLDFVDTDALADKAGEYMTFIARKLAANKDEVQLLQKPLEVLTPLFLEDLNHTAEKQTIVLLLDTYEQTGSFLDDWLRALLDERFGQLTANFLLAIAGRDPLSRNLWNDYEDLLLRSELEPFTEDEARQYLSSKGITNEAVIQEIWHLSSGGLPLLIGMMAQGAPTSVDVVIDPCEEAVERFLKWESDSTKRQLALDAALPRILNRDILALFVNESVNDLFDWLKERSFVIEHPEGWQYHNVVREQMLRYQRRLSLKAWKTQHSKLAEYYDSLRQELELTTTQQFQNEVWRKYTLEWLYHSLCANPLQKIEVVLSDWLASLDSTWNKSHNFPKQWAEVMHVAGVVIDSEVMKYWSQKLRKGLDDLETNNWAEIVEVLSDILNELSLEDQERSIALAAQGIIPLFCCIEMTSDLLNELNLEDHARAIALEAQGTNPLLCYVEKIKSCTWQIAKELNLIEVIASLTQAIDLDPNKANHYVGRGMAYFLRGDINKAKLDLNHAIEVDASWKDLQNPMETIFNDVISNADIQNLIEKNKDRKHFNLLTVLAEWIEVEMQSLEQTRQLALEKSREIQELEEEIQKLKEKVKNKRSLKRLLIQKLWTLAEAIYSQESLIWNMDMKFLPVPEMEAPQSGLQLFLEFINNRKEEIQSLEMEIRKTGESLQNGEEIQRLEEETMRKKEMFQKLSKEVLKLIDDYNTNSKKISNSN